MCDLILVGSYVNDDEIIRKTLRSVKNHKFNQKYILFDGPRDSEKKTYYDNYRKYKQDIIQSNEYKDFKIIEFPDNIYYRPMIDLFINNNYNDLSDNLLIIQDDVELAEFDLELLLERKSKVEDCKLLYFGENRKRAPHWFNVIDETDDHFVKIHGWSERAYVVNKKDFKDILDRIDKIKTGQYCKRFIDTYYHNFKKSKKWKDLSREDHLEYWKLWGCYEYKGVFHKHLCGKR